MKIFWLEEYDDIYWQERAFVDGTGTKSREDFKNDVANCIEKILSKGEFSWEALSEELYKIYNEFEPMEAICYDVFKVRTAETSEKIKETLFNENDELDNEEYELVPLFTIQQKHKGFKKRYRRFRSWRNSKRKMNFR